MDPPPSRGSRGKTAGRPGRAPALGCRDLREVSAPDRADLSGRRAAGLRILRSLSGRRAGAGEDDARADLRGRRVSISVVIPTYRRPETLFSVLDALGAQRDAPEFEVVVVDDGSGDDTPRRLEAYRPAYPFRYFSQSNGGPASARNRGVREARGRHRPFPGRRHGSRAALLAVHGRTQDEPRPHPVAVLGYTTWPLGPEGVALPEPHQRVRPAVRIRPDPGPRGGAFQLLLHLERLPAPRRCCWKRGSSTPASPMPPGRTSRSPTGS